jgi:hypothetical protein
MEETIMLTRDFWTGFITGTIVGAVGYRLIEQNNGQLQRLLQMPPMGAAAIGSTSGSEPSLEELVSQKERLEDLIAERNLTQ